METLLDHIDSTFLACMFHLYSFLVMMIHRKSVDVIYIHVSIHFWNLNVKWINISK